MHEFIFVCMKQILYNPFQSSSVVLFLDVATASITNNMGSGYQVIVKPSLHAQSTMHVMCFVPAAEINRRIEWLLDLSLVAGQMKPRLPVGRNR